MYVHGNAPAVILNVTKGIFLPTVRISSRLACEPVRVDNLGVRTEYYEDRIWER